MTIEVQTTESGRATRAVAIGVGAAYVMLALIIGFLWWRTLRTMDGLVDDQYITLTYVKNLVAGRGFVYNSGPPLIGTTSILFAMLTALFSWVSGVEPAYVAVVLGASFASSLGALLLVCRKRLGLNALQAVSLALMLLVGRAMFIGGEYPLLIFLILVSILLALSRRPFLTGLATGLVFLTRGEGAILAVVLTLHAMWSARPWQGAAQVRDAAKVAAWITLGFFLPLACWAVYAVPTFGAVLPHTLQTKMLHGREAAPADRFPAALWEDMQHTWGIMMVPWLELRWAIKGIWLVAAIGLVPLLRRPAWRLFAAWVVLYVAAYCALTLPAYSRWYQLPAMWLWLVCACLGWNALLSVPKRWRLLWMPPRIALAAALVFPLFAWPTLVETAIGLVRQGDFRRDTYGDLTNWINQHAAPGDVIAANEVGYFGYFTSQPILDLGAIVSPELLPGWKLGRSNIIVRDYKPKYYSTYSGTDLRDVPKRLEFPGANYELVRCPRGDTVSGWSYYPLYQITAESAATPSRASQRGQ